MQLITRRHIQNFIDFINWPTSRKAALYGFLCSLVTLGTPWLWFTLVPATRERVNAALLWPLVDAWTCIFLLIMLLSLPAAIRGRDARWTGYLTVVLASPFLVALIHLFGTMSTPLVAFFPCVVIMWALYFDERIAWAGLFNILLWLLVAGTLELLHVLAYAPLLVDRSVDAQAQTVWFGTLLMVTLVMSGFCFALCFFVIAARRLQEKQLNQAHRALARIHGLIRRYVPAQLAEKIAAGDQPETFRPERRRLTIFSSDIQGFTLASDELDAEELAGILNEYLSEMMAIADACGATVSHVAGDGMMILFGAPKATNDRDHALRAVRMAQAMQRRMRQLQEAWFLRGLERPFRIRIGIATGVCSVGDFGSQGRKLYSAIGVQSSLAQRIQSFCEPGRVLICSDTAELIRDLVAAAPKMEIPVKHLNNPVPLFELAEVAA